MLERTSNVAVGPVATLPRPMRWRLKGLGSSGRGLVLPLAVGEQRLGSCETSELWVDRDGVSREHAVLVVEARRLVVIDAESKNGTFVNGRRVRRAEVACGDVLSFGSLRLQAERVEAAEVELALEMNPPLAFDAEACVDSTVPALRRGPWQPDEPLEILSTLAAGLRTGEGRWAPVVDRMKRQTGASAVLVLELGNQSPPAVLAQAGEVSKATVDALTTVWGRRRERAGDSVVQRDGWIAAWVSRSDHSLALMLAGATCDSRLLTTALSMLELMWPAAGSGAPAKAADLRFPAGTVRCLSGPMRALYDQMRPLARSDLPALLVGETGVGKDCLVELLHSSSARRRGPLVVINCAAIPAELLEAELFGIGERVATGVARRRGRFQQAEGGTLFLDEIGEMPKDLQAKLLRVLQQKQVQPVGAAPVAIDVRLVAATNADIYQRMEAGEFRRDLFFRLAGVVLDVPPLRRRAADVPLFVEYFLHRFRREADKDVRGLTVRALELLAGFSWPGNVRELEHEIRRLVYVCPPGQAIDAAMLAERIGSPGAAPDVAGESAAETPDPVGADRQALPTLELAELERLAVRQAMRDTEGGVVEAARRLGITRFALRRRLLRDGLVDRPE